MTANYCPECGESLEEFPDPNFCPECGAGLGQNDAPNDRQESDARASGGEAKAEVSASSSSVTTAPYAKGGSRTSDIDPDEKKRKLREMANSDRPSAPIYAEKFRRDYDEEP